MRAPASSAQRALDKAYGAAVERLRLALPDSAKPDKIQDADRITADAIGALRGMGPSAWIEFDERGGYRDAEQWRFAVVRRARNSARFGRRLLDAINERVPGRPYA
jgi:hypothetical protein